MENNEEKMVKLSKRGKTVNSKDNVKQKEETLSKAREEILTPETERAIKQVKIVETPKVEPKKVEEKKVEETETTKHSYTRGETKKKGGKGKAVAATTVAVLAAAATVISPQIIYHKRNEEYEISIHSEVESFESYSVTVKRGATIETLKNKLNAIEGLELEGIDKDQDCKEPFLTTDKITKDTSVYLKYEVKKFEVRLPQQTGYKIIYSDTVDIENISWGESFEFRIVLDDSYAESSDNMVVRADGEELKANENGWYHINFVDKDIKISVGGIAYNYYTLGTIPKQVTITNAEGEKYTSKQEVEYGTKVYVSYNETEAYTVSEFTINGKPFENNTEIVVTEDLNILYKEVKTQGLEFVEVGGGYSISALENKSIKSVAIPERVNNKDVIEISSNAFTGCTSLTSISIPSTVKTIGSEAFKGCSSLKNIVLPNTLSAIGNSAFENCTNLSTIQIPESVTTIGYYTFKGCSALKSISIPNSVTTIQDGAFMNATKLTTVSLPSGLTELSKNLFSGCTGLTSVKLPSGLTAINEHAFFNASNLTYIEIPDSVTEIEDGAFMNAKILQRVTLPSGLTEISENLFKGCSNLLEVNLPQSLAKINSGAFMGAEQLSNLTLPESLRVVATNAFVNCSSLTELTIPNGVTTIESLAFANCENLKTVSIPESVSEFDQSAFYGCSSINEMNIESVVAIKSTQNEESSIFNANQVKLSLDACKLAFESTSGDGLLLFRLNSELFDEDFVRYQDEQSYTFIKKENLSSIEIPEGVTNIEANSFANSLSLKKIVLPKSLQTIGAGAFYNCNLLQEVTLQEGVTEIVGDYSQTYGAFEGCSNLSTINLPSTLHTIGDRTFANCVKLKQISLPTEITSVGVESFSGCSNIESISLNDGLQTISKSAFAGCVKLNNVILPSSVTNLSENAFENCPIVELTLPENVKSTSSLKGLNELNTLVIESAEVYSNLQSPESITNSIQLPYSVKNVRVNSNIIENETSNEYLSGGDFIKLKSDNYYKFEKNESVSNFIVEEGTTEILEESFINIKTLVSVQIPSSVTTIGANAFSGCVNLKNVTFVASGNVQADSSEENKSLHIDDSAFKGCASLETITLLDSVSEIGVCAFENCSSLREINLNKSAKIGEYAFNGCVSLTSKLSFDANATLGQGAFTDCVSITSVEIDGITTISNNLFSNCSNIQSVTLSNVENIGSEVFADCKNLESIDLIGVKTIGENAFNGCSGLNNLTIPESVTEVSSTAFNNCELTDVVIQSVAGYDSIHSGWTSNPVITVENEVESTALAVNDYLNEVTFYQFDSETHKFYCHVDENTIEFAVPNGVLKIESTTFAGNKNLKTIVIPDSVTEIETTAFKGCSSLKNITLSKELEILGDNAFEDCESLLNISLPGKLKVLGNSVFKGCVSMADVVLPSVLEDLGESSFEGCSSLSRISLPTDLKSLGTSAFKGCTSISNIALPEGLTTLGNATFEGCVSLSEISLPSGLTGVGHSLFSGCKSLADVKLNGLSFVPDGAFNGCSNLVSIDLNGVQTVGENAFINCLSLAKITNTAALTTIGKSAFKNCGSLTELSFEDVETISDEAFHYCVNLKSVSMENVVSIGQAFKSSKNLKSVKLPASLTTISDMSFVDCALEEIIIDSVNAFVSLTEQTYADATVKVLSSILENANSDTLQNSNYAHYENADYHFYHKKANLVNFIVPEGVTEIPENSFMDAFNLETIILPQSLKHIGVQAFGDSSRLRTVVFGDNVETIDDSAFINCTSLTNISLPKGLRTLNSSFAYCTSLKTITIPSTVVAMSNAFVECSSLETVHIEATSIDMSFAFMNCSNLKTVTFAYGLTELSSDAFAQCSVLENVSLPKTLKTIGDSAFFGCSSLNLEIPNSVEYIGDSAFANSGISGKLILSENLTTISYQTFFNCVNIDSVVIPSNVLNIDSTSFDGCGIKEAFIDSASAHISLGDAWFDSNIHLRVLIENREKYQNQFIDDVEYISLKDATYSHLYTKNADLEAFEIEEGITEICDNSFKNLKNLINVYIPSSLKIISSHAFDGCENLVSPNIENVESIGDYAFKGTKLLDVMSFKNVQRIGNAAFVHSSLYNATDLNNIEHIGECAFASSDLRYVTFGDNASIRTIEYGTFEDCVDLMEINLPSTVTTVQDNAFKNCSSLKYITPEGNLTPCVITHFGSEAFNNCSTIDVSIPDNTAIYIGPRAFQGSGITGAINLAEGSDVGESAFESCKNITSVETNNFNTASGIFKNCINIQNVIINYGDIAESMFEGCSSLNNALFDRVGSFNIGKKAFMNCSSLTQINTECAVTIGESAFEGCSGLLQVHQEATTIGNAAFKDCTSLIDVSTNTYALETIGESAFENCVDLRLPLHNYVNLTTIRKNAFYNCKSLNSVVIPSSVTTMGDAFNNCYLSSVTVNSKVVINAFTSSWVSHEINNLGAVIIPKDLTIPSNSKFQNATISPFNISTLYRTFENDTHNYYYYRIVDSQGFPTLTTITIPEGITKISDYAFHNSINLTELTLPSTITEVGTSAFENCNKLKTILTYGNIGASAFAACDALETITTRNCLSIGEYAFSLCENLTKLNISSVNTIGDYAFQIGEYGTNLLTDFIYMPNLSNMGIYVFANRCYVNIHIGSKANDFLESLKETDVFGGGSYNNRFEYIKQVKLTVWGWPTNCILFSNHDKISYVISEDGGTASPSTFLVTIERPAVYSVESTSESVAVAPDIQITTAKDYNKKDTSWLNGAVQVTVKKSVVDNKNNSNAYLTADNFIIFLDDEYYYYIAKFAIDESVEYTQIVSYDGAVYVGTDDNPYHTFLYRE